MLYVLVLTVALTNKPLTSRLSRMTSHAHLLILLILLLLLLLLIFAFFFFGRLRRGIEEFGPIQSSTISMTISGTFTGWNWAFQPSFRVPSPSICDLLQFFFFFYRQFPYVSNNQLRYVLFHLPSHALLFCHLHPVTVPSFGQPITASRISVRLGHRAATQASVSSVLTWHVSWGLKESYRGEGGSFEQWIEMWEDSWYYHLVKVSITCHLWFKVFNMFKIYVAVCYFF